MLQRLFMAKNPGKVRVVVVSDSMHPWNFGGKEERLRHFHAAYLTTPESEYEVLYATMKWWSQDAPENYFAISKLRPLYINERRSIRQALFFALSCVKIIRFRPDIIEADQIPILQLFVIKLVAKISRASFSVTWHEVWDESDWQTYLGRFGRLASKIESLAMQLPDRIVAVSVPTRFKLIHAGVPEHTIELIEPDIDRDAILRAETKLPATDLLFAGRMIANKNLDLLIEAVALLAGEGARVTVSLVGDGPELFNLINLAKELGVHNQITFHGFLSNNEDVWGLMKKCAVFISPSTREGFGFSVMEAHFAGARLVIADHPNNAATHYLNELDGVTLVSESSARAFADAIRDLAPYLITTRDSSKNEVANIYQKYEHSWGKIMSRVRGAS